MKRILLISALLLAVICTVSADRRRLLGARNVAAASGITADLWQTFEGTMDVAGLEANDNNASATWLVNNPSSYITASASAERATVSTVNSTSDSGTLGAEFALTGASAAYLTCNFGSDKANISIGFWFKAPVAPTVNRNLIRGQNNAGSDALDTITFRYSTKYVGWGAAGNNNGTALTVNTWYWITIQYNQNATCYLRVYDTAGALVGSEATVAAPNIAERKLYLLDYNGLSLDAGVSIYIDDLVVTYSATFPLGP